MNYLSNLKIKNIKFSFLFIYVLSVMTIFLFLYGFFPRQYSAKLTESKTEDKRDKRSYIDRLAFIVIDALRYDFVKPSGSNVYMPFTWTSIKNGESCCLITKAHSPTVTMPRLKVLKAITSGSVSTYIDVVLNFMTSSFEEDNIINQAVSKGLKLVFYGDDTWLKLFPHSFIRSEGTNSFFTYDYVEVDNNVSRHIDGEFKKNDWDIIILHYLGLDHIGHTEGPNSPAVKPKLLEMDGIIKRFHEYFDKLEKSQSLKTMLIVTSDHGMKDTGSHGGVTYPEVTVPLVSIGKPCVTLPGWPETHTSLQIDLAPTLSTLFGLPIPVRSVGKLIPSLLHGMSTEDILKNLEINRMKVGKFINSINTGGEVNSLENELESWLSDDSKNEEVGRNLTRKYFQILNKMSQELVYSDSDFKLIFLIIGVIFLWSFLFCLILELLKHFPKPRSLIHWFFITGTILHAISLASNSFIEEEHQTWYFLWATFCVFTFLESVRDGRKMFSLHKFKTFVLWGVVAVTHRILKKLNQTGDKWAHLPDLKFYLHSEEGQPWLFFVFLVGVCCAVGTFGEIFIELRISPKPSIRRL